MDNLSGKTGECRRGFFVIRRCQKPAIAQCAFTGQAICEDCAEEHEGDLVCREALYERKYENEWQNRRSLSAYDYDDYHYWYYGTRSRFYHDENYEPFNDYDADGFQEGIVPGEDGGAYYDEETGQASFYDS